MTFLWFWLVLVEIFHDFATRIRLAEMKRIWTQIRNTAIKNDIYYVKGKGNRSPMYFLQDKGISAFPDGDNLLSWIGTVEGPQVVW